MWATRDGLSQAAWLSTRTHTIPPPPKLTENPCHPLSADVSVISQCWCQHRLSHTHTRVRTHTHICCSVMLFIPLLVNQRLLHKHICCHQSPNLKLRNSRKVKSAAAAALLSVFVQPGSGTNCNRGVWRCDRTEDHLTSDLHCGHSSSICPSLSCCFRGQETC